MTKKSSWKAMNASDVIMDGQHDVAHDESDTIPPYLFRPKGHMRHDEKNEISVNHGRIRGLRATWSWCVVVFIVIGSVCFPDDSGAEPLSTSSGGNSCDSQPSLNQDQAGTQGSASNCQKQDGDLVAHEYNKERSHFFRISKPFGKDPTSLAAKKFITDCTQDRASPGRCIDYTDAYKNLLDFAKKKNTVDGEKITFEAEHYVSQIILNKETGKLEEVLVRDPTSIKVRVPVRKRILTDPEKKRLEVLTTMTRAGAQDHANDEWRLVEVDKGGSNGPEWTNICGDDPDDPDGLDRLAMVMFGRVETDYKDSWSPLRLDMVLRLKPNTKEIDTKGLEMVIVCQTSMTAKCAYEHGYRPWATLKDQYDRTVPPEDVAALLSTCALASTQCTKDGNHIAVIDDLGMNRPYPLDYGKEYFEYEGTFRYGDGNGDGDGAVPHREHVCRLREGEISLRCQARFKQLHSAGCEFENEKYHYRIRTFTYLDKLLGLTPSYSNDELLITDDGKWYAGLKTGLQYNGNSPPFGMSGRRVMIWSKAGASYPKRPAGALQKSMTTDVHVDVIARSPYRKILLDPGHFYTTFDFSVRLSDGHMADISDSARRYLNNLEGKPFDYVTCKSYNLLVACFMYRSKRGEVIFTRWNDAPWWDAAPKKLYWFHGSR